MLRGAIHTERNRDRDLERDPRNTGYYLSWTQISVLGCLTVNPLKVVHLTHFPGPYLTQCEYTTRGSILLVAGWVGG